jgi:hypothetical protein
MAFLPRGLIMAREAIHTNGAMWLVSIGVVIFASLIAAPRVANAQCQVGTFERPIQTAGLGDQLISSLPIPIPYPILRVRNTLRGVASGVLTVRALTFDGNIEAAVAQKEAIAQQVVFELSYLTDQISNIPVPIPAPVQDILPALSQIMRDLLSEISSLPVPLP